MKSKIFRILFSLTFTVLVFSSASLVSAHVLKTDGVIGAVFHTDPDDDPIVNQPTGFYFDLKDTTSKFNPKECDCRVKITKDGNVIYDKPALISPQGSDYLVSAGFTFPDRAVYQISLSGRPNVASTFQPFNLAYDLRVNRVVETGKKKDSGPVPIYYHAVHYGLFGIGFLIILYIIVDEKRKEKKRSSKDEII